MIQPLRLFSLGECGRGARAVEMDDLPLPVAAVPHPGLLWLGGTRRPVAVDVLRHSDVSNARGLVADQVDVRVQDGGVDRFAVFRPHWGGGFRSKRLNSQRPKTTEPERGEPSNRAATHSFQNKSGGSRGLPPDSPGPRARTPSRLGHTFSCLGWRDFQSKSVTQGWRTEPTRVTHV